MAVLYLLKEDGGRLNLENGSGSLLLEAVGLDIPTGGRGRPWHEIYNKPRKNKTEELFRSIEQALEVALGLAEVPVEAPAEPERAAVVAPAYDAEGFRQAVGEILRRSTELADAESRLERLQALLRAYEEAEARERALQDDEEAWFLLT